MCLRVYVCVCIRVFMSVFVRITSASASARVYVRVPEYMDNQ